MLHVVLPTGIKHSKHLVTVKLSFTVKTINYVHRQDLREQIAKVRYVTRMLMFTKSVTVSITVSKWDLFFSMSGVKTNTEYCWDI